MKVRACDLASGAPVFGNQGAIAQRSSPELALTRSNRHTVDPLRVPTDHPSPSAQEFRLLLNGLATSELGRIFCSCRQLQGGWESRERRETGGLVHVSRRVKRWHD